MAKASILKSTYLETYPIDLELGDKPLSAKDEAYATQPFVIFTTLLGLPNQRRRKAPDNQFTFFDLLKNMLDIKPAAFKNDPGNQLQNESNTFNVVLDAVLAAPMFIFHVAKAIFTIPFNLAKLFTEFLPGLVKNKLQSIMERHRAEKTPAYLDALVMVDAYKDYSKDFRDKYPPYIQAKATIDAYNKSKDRTYYVASFFHGLVSGFMFLGRAITSPVKNFKIGVQKHPLLGALSAFITIAAYAAGSFFAWPFMVAAIGPTFSSVVAPAVLSVIGSAFLVQAQEKLAGWVQPGYGFVKSLISLFYDIFASEPRKQLPKLKTTIGKPVPPAPAANNLPRNGSNASLHRSLGASSSSDEATHSLSSDSEDDNRQRSDDDSRRPYSSHSSNDDDDDAKHSRRSQP